MVEHVRVDAGGVSVHVAVAGSADAPPLLLLHGWPETWRCWEAVIPLLAGEFRLVMPDLRGFGDSDAPEATASYAMPVAIADALAVLDHFGIERAGVVAHDFGGAVAWALGSFVPDRVDRMVVMCSPHPLRLRNAALEDPRQLQRSFYVWLMHAGPEGEALLSADGFRPLASWAFAGSRIPPGTVESYRASWSRPGRFHAMAGWYRANYRPSLFDPGREITLPPVTVPTRYLHGEHDQGFVAAAATGSGEFVAAAYDEILIPGVGHWLTHDVPETVAGAVREWMSVSDGSASVAP
jgi:pimeloyl-ACP methyl ester carboxylesterase